MSRTETVIRIFTSVGLLAGSINAIGCKSSTNSEQALTTDRGFNLLNIDSKNSIPSEYPVSPDDIAAIVGGAAQNWRRDTYMGPDGAWAWDGTTFVFEAFPLKPGVVYQDGFHRDANGNALFSPDEIYDFSQAPQWQDINIGALNNRSDAYGVYASGWTGGGNPKNPNILRFGYGEAMLEEVEQAVIRIVPGDCPPTPDADNDPVYPSSQKKGRSEAINGVRLAIENDPNVQDGTVQVQLWNDETNEFEYVDMLEFLDELSWYYHFYGTVAHELFVERIRASIMACTAI